MTEPTSILGDHEAIRLPSDRALMRLHVEALFTHDQRGRMVRVNEPSGKAAPRFFLGRTIEGIDWRLRDDLEEALCRELEAACLAEAGEGQDPSLQDSTRYETLLARYAPIQRTWTGPAYRFPLDLRTSEDVVLVTDENSHILRPHLQAWLGDVADCQPMLARVADGGAVSICASVRITSTAHEAGVETSPEYRGRGYATQVVSAWARAVRAMSRIPLYSTSWQNTASQALAKRLSLVRYGIDLHIT